MTKPRIGSPGTGVQHLASLTSTSDVPLTTTPVALPLLDPAAAGDDAVLAELVDDGVLAALGGDQLVDHRLRADRALADRGVQRVDVGQLMKPATAVRCSSVSSRCSGRPALRSWRASASLPSSIDSSRRSRVKWWRILFRARGLRTNASQSRLGPASSALEVRISTTSPLTSSDSSGTSRPFTRAPIVRLPTSVWIE